MKMTRILAVLLAVLMLAGCVSPATPTQPQSSQPSESKPTESQPAQSEPENPGKPENLLAEFNFNQENTENAAGEADAVLYNDKSMVGGTYIDGISGKALQLSDKSKGDKLWLDIPMEILEGKNINIRQ